MPSCILQRVGFKAGEVVPHRAVVLTGHDGAHHVDAYLTDLGCVADLTDEFVPVGLYLHLPRVQQLQGCNLLLVEIYAVGRCGTR